MTPDFGSFCGEASLFGTRKAVAQSLERLLLLSQTLGLDARVLQSPALFRFEGPVAAAGSEPKVPSNVTRRF
jgi:hypothetical protein